MQSRSLNNYEGLLPAFQKAHADFGSSGFHLTAWPIKGEHRRWPPEEVEGYECFGICDLPNIEGFPSETYGLYAVSGEEFSEALETFRQLASLAGASLPAVIRDVLPHCASGGVVGLWVRFLWYFGLPDRSDRAKLEWHFERVGSGILSVCDYWLMPFRASSLAIERCRLDTDSPAFFRLDEIPALAQQTAPEILGSPREELLAGGPDATENKIGVEVGEFKAVGLKGEAKALALLVQHPEWSNTQIAAEVGCSRTSLYRWARYLQARRAMCGTLPKGFKSAEGDLEAYED